MTKKYNILTRKPIHGEVIYLPCFTAVGGYIRKDWLQGDKSTAIPKLFFLKIGNQRKPQQNFF